jgi:hypothetical protein
MVSRWSDGLCAIDVDVGVKNGSKQTVTVSATSLRLWTYTPAVDPSNVSSLDWGIVHALPPAWELSQDQGQLNMTYEPGQGASYSHTVFVPMGAGRLIHARLAVSSPEGGIASEFFAERTAPFGC